MLPGDPRALREAATERERDLSGRPPARRAPVPRVVKPATKFMPEATVPRVVAVESSLEWFGSLSLAGKVGVGAGVALGLWLAWRAIR